MGQWVKRVNGSLSLLYMIADDARLTPPSCKKHTTYHDTRITPHRCKMYTAFFARSTGKFPSYIKDINVYLIYRPRETINILRNTWLLVVHILGAINTVNQYCLKIYTVNCILF